jgi:cytosine/adenosine deaminase-related metal-dependent hydrolase
MSIPELLKAHQTHHDSHEGRLQVWAAAGTPRGTAISHYLELGEICARHGISATMHCAEAPRDREIYRDTYQCSAMEFIRDAKLCGQKTASGQGSDQLSHRLVLAHMVNLDEDVDIPLLASTRTSVAHNPSSNLKLASGVAPVPSMLSAPSPVNVSLGTDGAPCSNHYDMFQEMRLAAILHKGVHHDARLIPAEVALEMATINGAKALGLDHEIGSLEEGKKADFVVVDPYGAGGLGAVPWSRRSSSSAVSPVTTVVHGCTGRDVDMTVVNGVILVREGRLVRGGRSEELNIIRMAQEAVEGLLQRCNQEREQGQEIGGKLMAPWNYI